MRRRAGARALAGAMLLGACSATFAAERPLLPPYDASSLARACDTGLAHATDMIRAMEAKRTAGGIFDEWNRLAIALEDVGNPAYLLANVAPDKAVREAAEPCLARFSALETELFQDAKLHRRVRSAKPASAHQAKLREDLLGQFEDAGASLTAAKRARANAILDELDSLREAFDRDVRDDPTEVAFTPAEMDGLPPAYLESRKRDAEGRYVLGLDAAIYVPFMENATSGAARERYYRAKLGQGGMANLDRLAKMNALRQELAALHGSPSYAAYVLRHRMLSTPRAVEKFLGDVHGAVALAERRELDQLRAAKAEALATPAAATRLEPWDIAYYQERLRRERFAIDPAALRAHFPPDESVAYMLRIAQRLYGVTFREVPVATWHPDVRYFDVLDASSGTFVSGLYLDLRPREGKDPRTAAFPIRGASARAGRTPLAALVASLEPAGLTPDELATLMHEFCHVLHDVLSQVEYDPASGTATKADFVEAPSRMFEAWARREQPLRLFREVCADCVPLTRDEIERLEASRRFGAGIRYARQWLYAAYDMALATGARDPLATWKRLESATPLGHVEGTRFPASFTHVADGYAGGYYAYLWSDALALDLLAAFDGDLMDPAVGARLRAKILSQGAQRDERAMVRDFLGRAPSDAAFLDAIGRCRN